MKLNKRFFLITATVALLFGAIAVGPVYKRTVTPVRAEKKPAQAVAIITCSSVLENATGTLSQPVVNNVDFTLGLTLTNFGSFATGADCATALQNLVGNGFERQDASTAPVGNAVNQAFQGLEFTWVYVKGGPENPR